MKYLFLSLAALFMFGCGNSNHKETSEHHDSANHEGHHHEEESKPIELNNGEKWKVNDSMMLIIKAMEKQINEFSSSNNSEYAQLGTKLQSQIDVLTSSCTMEGKAHDELHKWLLPYIEMVDSLTQTTTKEAGEKQFQEIQNSFMLFNQYFQ